MTNFEYSKTLPNGINLYEQLAEDITIEGEHLNVKFEVSFDGLDVKEFAHKLREIDIDSVEFSNEEEFMKDVQLIIDENYINEIFLQLFHS